MKLIFLMLDYPNNLYEKLYKEGAQKTWAENVAIDFLRYRGIKKSKNVFDNFNNFQKSRLGVLMWPLLNSFRKNENSSFNISCTEDRKLTIQISDSWRNHGMKTRLALDYCLKNFDFDYLIRGNASTYVNIEALISFLKNELPIYAGPIEKSKKFASGWAIVLNRDAAKVIASGNHEELNRYFDDEAIGLILQRMGIFPSSVPYFWATRKNEIDSKEINSIPFIRTKVYDNNGERIDNELMLEIHHKLKDVSKPW